MKCIVIFICWGSYWGSLRSPTGKKLKNLWS